MVITVRPRTPLGHAISYATSDWPAFVRHIDYGEVEIDNNLTENSIPPIALARKKLPLRGITTSIFIKVSPQCSFHDARFDKNPVRMGLRPEPNILLGLRWTIPGGVALSTKGQENQSATVAIAPPVACPSRSLLTTTKARESRQNFPKLHKTSRCASRVLASRVCRLWHLRSIPHPHTITFGSPHRLLSAFGEPPSIQNAQIVRSPSYDAQQAVLPCGRSIHAVQAIGCRPAPKTWRGLDKSFISGSTAPLFGLS